MVLALAAFLIVLPWLLNIWYGHRIKCAIIDRMNEGTFFNDFTRDERREVVDQLLASLPQRKGMSRFSKMVGVIFIIAAAVFYILFIGGTSGLPPESAALLQNMPGVLTGASATMIGFYFGGRAEEVTTDTLEAPGEAIRPADRETTPGKTMKKPAEAEMQSGA